jgi:glutathione S-transferase
MKLYYAPGACSISPHVALRESGLPFELVKVDFMRGRTTSDGTTLSAVNPKNYVPALVLDDGALLTEGAVMVQLIADLAPASNLAPPNGTFARVRLQEWLNYIATELHKGSSPLFNPKIDDATRAATLAKLATRFAYVEERLGEQTFLTGDAFTIADGYMLYALRTYARFAKDALAKLPRLAAYLGRLEERPSVRASLEAEGLSPTAL